MILKNYKHIKYLEFNFNNSQYLCTKDLLLKNDLLELIRLILGNKKLPAEAFLKWTEFDYFFNLKNLRIINVPSFIDWQKDLINGSKSLLKMLVYEILTIIEPQNNSLIEIQKIIENFKIEKEFAPFESFLEQLKLKHEIKVETFITNSISNLLAEEIKINFFNSLGEMINENLLSNLKIKELYFDFLKFLSTIVDEEVLVLIDDPFYGLKGAEILKLSKAIADIKNKIVFCFMFPEINEEIASVALLINGEEFYDFSKILNDFEDFKFFVDGDVKTIIKKTLISWLKNYNLLDDQTFSKEFLEIEAEKTIFKVIINK